MAAKVAVFPASGKLGSSVVKYLMRGVLPTDTILICRKPETLASFAAAGATIRRADYDDTESLQRVFEGANILMLISYPSYEVEHRANAHKNAIEAAVAAGVKYIFYSSLAFASGLGSSSSNQIMQAHLLTEKYLHEQAVAGRLSYTCIREGIYSESFPLYLAALDLERPAHDILIPHSGSGPGIAWVKTDELGEATANLIISCAKNVGNFPYRNQTMLLSGCQELSLNDTVDIVAEITQRPLAIRETSVEASLGAIMARPVNPIATGYRGGGPEAYASLFESIKNGEAATTSTVLGELLGREPERFAVTAREMIKSISSSL